MAPQTSVPALRNRSSSALSATPSSDTSIDSREPSDAMNVIVRAESNTGEIVSFHVVIAIVSTPAGQFNKHARHQRCDCRPPGRRMSAEAAAMHCIVARACNLSLHARNIVPVAGEYGAGMGFAVVALPIRAGGAVPRRVSRADRPIRQCTAECNSAIPGCTVVGSYR